MPNIPTRYDHLFFNIGRQLGIDPWVLKGIAWHESRLDESAHAYGDGEKAFYRKFIKDRTKWTDHRYYDQPRIIGGGHGLMQLQYTTAILRGVDFPHEGDWWKLYIPVNNIYFGGKYYLKKYRKYGNLSQALAAYNAGTATWINDPSSPNQGHFRNQAYVNQVQIAIETVSKDWALRGVKISYKLPTSCRHNS